MNLRRHLMDDARQSQAITSSSIIVAIRCCCHGGRFPFLKTVRWLGNPVNLGCRLAWVQYLRGQSRDDRRGGVGLSRKPEIISPSFFKD
jgi:hypothetical protein